jgi:hypothetical protein
MSLTGELQGPNRHHAGELQLPLVHQWRLVAEYEFEEAS